MKLSLLVILLAASTWASPILDSEHPSGESPKRLLKNPVGHSSSSSEHAIAIPSLPSDPTANELQRLTRQKRLTKFGSCMVGGIAMACSGAMFAKSLHDQNLSAANAYAAAGVASGAAAATGALSSHLYYGQKIANLRKQAGPRPDAVVKMHDVPV